MNENETVEVYYPFWVQVISRLGIPALTGTGLWLISRPMWEEGIGARQFIVGAILGSAVLYQCFIGWHALRYLGIRMVASAEGIELHSGAGQRYFSWKEFATPKEYTFATTTHFALHSGEIIIYAFDNMKNIDVVKKLLKRSHADSEG